MEPPTLVKTFNYCSSQQPMFSVLEPPLHYRSSSNPSKFEDISFSSYIKSKDPLHQNGVVAADDTEISIFDAQKYFSENTDMKSKQSHETPRLSFSSADGYGRNFRTRSFHATPTASSEASWNSQTGLLANPPGSVGVSLRNFASDEGKRRIAGRKWGFGRKCCCTGKKSVEVKEAMASDSEHGGPVTITSENNNNGKATKRDSYKAKAPSSLSQRSSITNDILEIHQHKLMPPNPLRMSLEDDLPANAPPRQQRISASGRPFVDGAAGFSFPILNTSTQAAKPVRIIMKPVISPLEDPPRDSLEVFQPMPASVSRPQSLDNPVNSRPHDFNPGSPIARVTNNADDDNGSDASSDLFEIESFSTQTTSYPMYRRRDSLEDAPTFNVRRFASANGLTLNNNNNNSTIQYGRRSLDEPPTPSIAATECYAPSEVSIDWSVTTAEGYDRASVSNFSISASEVGTAAFLRHRLQEEGGGGSDSGRRKGNGGGGGGLLMMSCRQEKAVSVGPQPVKAEAPPVFPLHVGGRPPRANKPPLGSDHSARLSLAFAA